MNVIVRNIPNSITCLNLVAGCMAITCAAQGSAPLWGLDGTAWAYVFIGVAAVADFCDGLAARLLHAYSSLGKELDSLCDLVSFGVAPAMTLYFMLPPDGWVRWTAVVIAVCGALRLARFNIDDRQSTSFIGLPIPANAIFWIGYTSLMETSAPWMASPAVLLPVVLVESWLMVSPLRMFSLKFSNLRWGGNQRRWLLIAAAAVSVACLGTGGLMWLIAAYVLMSLVPSGTPAR